MSTPGDGGALAPPFEFPVERGKILEFARAIQSRNAAFYGPEPLAPPTFLMVAGSIWGYSWEQPGDSPLADTPVDPTRTLHLEEAYRFSGPPLRAGDLLEGRLRLLPPVEKLGRRSGPMTIYTTETTFVSGQGQEIARARQVVAYLHGTGETQPDAPVPPAREPAPQLRDADDAAGSRRLGPLRLEDFVRYQGASGDLNPYHYDRTVLEASGGTQLIAPGMFPAGVLGGLVADAYGAGCIREISFRFREPVLLGDTITCRVEPAVEQEPADELVLDLSCERGTGEIAISGSARVQLS